MVLVADDRDIIRNGADGRIVLVNVVRLACRLIVLDARVAAETDFLRVLRALQLERIEVLQPVVRYFLLEAVDDLLAEHAVVVADAAAICVIAACRERIHEARRKTAEAAVAERRIRFLILDRVDVKTELFERFLDTFVLAEVQQVVAERAADQELHGKIVDDLGLLLVECLAGVHPLVDDRVLDDVRHCLEDLLL